MSLTIPEWVELAEDNLRAAEVLIREGHYAIAVSRSYYTMFYLAKAIMLREGQTFSKHAGVISALGKELVAKGRFPKPAHQSLVRAHEQRMLSDYERPKSFSREDAEEQLLRAQEFLEVSRTILERKQ